MRTVAILASYNEERFIAAAIENYTANGVEVYLIDNESTDRTVEIAREYLGRGLTGIETVERRGCHRWHAIVERKEEVALRLKTDWVIAGDPDEIRLSPFPGISLHDALGEAERDGCNAVNFFEYGFVPTAESPDHDHGDFRSTMKWYYPFSPRHPNRVTAWKKKAGPFFRNSIVGRLKFLRPKEGFSPYGLSRYGGHLLEFEGLKIFPVDFIMKHYLCLSLSHAVEKYSARKHDPDGLARGWHGWRNETDPSLFRLPPEKDLRFFRGDENLDRNDPLSTHPIVPDWIPPGRRSREERRRHRGEDPAAGLGAKA